MANLNKQDSARLEKILGETMEIQPGFANLSHEDAVEVTMLVEGISKEEAEFRVAIERGEIAGDVQIVDEPSN